MRPQEEQYRRRIAIEVPGLSPAAAAALTTIALTFDTDPRVLDAVVAQAVATSEQLAEIEAFASAVARRFGANGSAADWGLEPAQGLTREEQKILSGGRIVASCLAEDSLDHLIARVTSNACERDLRPAVIQRKVTNGYRAMWAARGEADVRTVAATAALRTRATPFATLINSPRQPG